MKCDKECASGYDEPNYDILRCYVRDESVWQAWVAKGRAKDKGKRARLSASVRYAVIAVLLLVAAGVG